jgi:hypothetical protein
LLPQFLYRSSLVGRQGGANPRNERAWREGHSPLRSPNSLLAGNQILQVGVVSNIIKCGPNLVKTAQLVEKLKIEIHSVLISYAYLYEKKVGRK